MSFSYRHFQNMALVKVEATTFANLINNVYERRFCCRRCNDYLESGIAYTIEAFTVSYMERKLHIELLCYKDCLCV